MIQPDALKAERPHGPWSCRGSDIWETLCAAAAGDAGRLSRLLERDTNLYRAAYWYTQPIHFAVREGHIQAVRVLLAAGADPGLVGLGGEDLITTARDRGHEDMARLLEDSRARRYGPTGPTGPDAPVHRAATAGDVEGVRHLLDAAPHLVNGRDLYGGTPLHRAVEASARAVVQLLLERGADVHAVHGSGPGSASGYAPEGFQPIDLALWSGLHWGVRGDLETARLLLERGAAYDLVIAAALGDEERVGALLSEDVAAVRRARPCGKRALSAAVDFGHERIVRLLLHHAADPTWPDGVTAPTGAALHAAAWRGDREIAALLLRHGADPNGHIDSSGSATFAASTKAVRALLVAHGGVLDAHDLVWLGEYDEAVRCVSQDPAAAARAGCGGVLAAACALGKRELLIRLLDAGARVPAVLTECRSYLLSDPVSLRILLDAGMDPDLPNWLLARPLHDLCSRDGRGRPRPRRVETATVLLDAGADIAARDEDYRSTPLAWAARNNLPDMVALLLERGAATSLPDDEPWATPLAWAERRGHTNVAGMLRRAGASA